MTDNPTLTLSAVNTRELAFIQGFASHQQTNSPEALLTKRLRHAGFMHGEPIEVMWRGWGKRANVVVRLGRHTHFALRHHEAAHVLVSRYRHPSSLLPQVAPSPSQA